MSEKDKIIARLQRLYNGEDYHDQIVGQCINEIVVYYKQKDADYIKLRDKVLKETAEAISKEFNCSAFVVTGDKNG